MYGNGPKKSPIVCGFQVKGCIRPEVPKSKLSKVWNGTFYSQHLSTDLYLLHFLEVVKIINFSALHVFKSLYF